MKKFIKRNILFPVIKKMLPDEYSRNIMEINWFIEDECEKELKKLELSNIKKEDKEIKKLDILLKYGKITEKDYKKLVLEIKTRDKTEKEKELEKLKLKKEFGEISEKDFEKKKFDIEGKPWFSIKESNFNPDDLSFEIEFDWNEKFIETLKKIGFSGKEEEMVEFWFFSICKVALGDDEVFVNPNSKKIEEDFNPRTTREEEIGENIKKYE